jgi:hypothetical protein
MTSNVPGYSPGVLYIAQSPTFNQEFGMLPVNITIVTLNVIFKHCALIPVKI